MILYNWDKMACSDWAKCLKEKRVRLWSCIIGTYVEIKKYRKGGRGRGERERGVQRILLQRKERKGRRRVEEERKFIVSINSYKIERDNQGLTINNQVKESILVSFFLNHVISINSWVRFMELMTTSRKHMIHKRDENQLKLL